MTRRSRCSSDPRRCARARRLVEVGQGVVLLVEGDEAARLVLEAVVLYAFADTRGSSAAEAWQRKGIGAL